MFSHLSVILSTGACGVSQHALGHDIKYLPPANEVAGRQCFHKDLSVILSTRSVRIPACTWAGMVKRGVAKECTPPPPGNTTSDGFQSGRYASYWNTSLFRQMFVTNISSHKTGKKVIAYVDAAFVQIQCSVLVRLCRYHLEGNGEQNEFNLSDDCNLSSDRYRVILLQDVAIYQKTLSPENKFDTVNNRI